MACRGWLAATQHLPRQAASKYAAEGTVAHNVLELALTFDLPPEELCENPDMSNAVAHAVDWVKQYLVGSPETEYQSEFWLPWGAAIGHAKLGGTADLVMANSIELVIGDYKHGAGLLVEPDSPQLMCYMLGLRQIAGPRQRYKQVIFQPRARHIDGPVREHIYDDFDLDTFAKEVQNAVNENLKGNVRRTAGEHCRWCAAAPTCRTLAEKALYVAAGEFAAADIASLLD